MQTDARNDQFSSCEKHSRIILESASDGFCLLNMEGRYQDVNDAYCQMVGYSRDELLAMSIQDLEAVETPEVMARRLEAIKAAGRDRFETKLRRKDGQILDVEVSVTLIPALKGISLFQRDIVAHKRTEMALRDSEERFRSLIEQAPIAIAISRNKTLTYANSAYVRLHGFERGDEIIGMSAIERVAPESRNISLERTRRREQGLPVETHYEFVGLRRDGTRFPLVADVARVDLPDGPANIGFFQDVTERKRAEAQVRWLASFPEMNQNPVMEADLDGHVYYANPASKAMFPNLETLGKGHPFLNLSATAIASLRDRPADALFREVYAAGIWFHVSLTYLPDNQHVRLYAINISQRKQEEAHMLRLQAVIEQFSKALTPSEVAQVLVDLGLGAMGASAGSVVLLTEDRTALEVVAAVGYPPPLLNVWQRFPVDAPLLLTDAVRQGQALWFETLESCVAQYPMLAGKPDWPGARVALPLMANGQPLGAIGLAFAHAQTFTEEDRRFMLALAQQCAQALERARLYEAERQARAEAETAKQRFRMLADAGALLAGSLDYETTLKNLESILLPAFADSYIIDLLESQDAETLRRVALGATDPSVRAALGEFTRRFERDPRGISIRAALRSGQPYLVTEVTPDMIEQVTEQAEQAALIRQIGTTSTICLPMMVRGKAIGVLTVAMNESGRRYRAEDVSWGEELARRVAQAIDNARLYERAQMNADALRQQVTERTQELQRALDRVQDADRVKTQMLANVSHEMRTPLSSITGFSNLLLSRQLEPDKQRQYLTAIQEEGWRLTTLVDDLLDLQRITSGHLAFRFTQVDLPALIQATLRKQPRLGNIHRIQFMPVSMPPVLADSDRIRQVLLNLVSNALKFSEGAVEVALHQDAAMAHVSVRDQGVGIPAHELDGLFELFHRGAAAERERIQGTGLGLVLCREIIEAHQGRIWAESAGEGQGATFHFTLPYAS